MRADANILSGTATIVYDETRLAPGDIKTFIAEWDADRPRDGASGSRRAAASDALGCQRRRRLGHSFFFRFRPFHAYKRGTTDMGWMKMGPGHE